MMIDSLRKRGVDLFLHPLNLWFVLRLFFLLSPPVFSHVYSPHDSLPMMAVTQGRDPRLLSCKTTNETVIKVTGVKRHWCKEPRCKEGEGERIKKTTREIVIEWTRESDFTRAEHVLLTSSLLRYYSTKTPCFFGAIESTRFSVRRQPALEKEKTRRTLQGKRRRSVHE